jgi:uncharacterized protein YaiI (UPF0178 family)
MGIWVDADACPRAVRDILVRAAERCQIDLVFVANHRLDLPRSRFARQRSVGHGFDVADDEIVALATTGSLVITADIPLAARLIEKQVAVISPRGEEFTPDTIRERLAMRDLLETLRASGMAGGGPPPLAAKDHQQFANALDRYLARTQAKRQQND